MSLAIKTGISEAEYLTQERAAEFKSEFVRGEIFAMSGGTDRHSLIAVNCARLIGNTFVDRPCRVFNSDMRVRTKTEESHHYPDLSALCGPPGFLDDTRDVLLNPSLIIEVLSDSTEAYDRGKKFALYRGIPSLREYVLIDQNQVLIDVYRRQDDGSWSLYSYNDAAATVHLESVDSDLQIGAVYDKVEFDRADN
jgi:Uma2 family endonuclease